MMAHKLGIFSVSPRGKPGSEKPVAPRTNTLLTVTFALGVIGFFVNAVFVEQSRCAAGQNRLTQFGTRSIAECGTMISSFSCKEASPGTGSDIFDSTTCAPKVCKEVNELQTVPAKDCETTAWTGTIRCDTAFGYRPGLKDCEGGMSPNGPYVTCTGMVEVQTCKTYDSCEGFYFVCPPLFDRIGVASGYASALFSICATAFKIRVRVIERRRAEPNGNAI